MRILVVDDEPVVAQTLALIFLHHGFDAVSAYDAEQALTAVRSSPPDLVLCDIDMPGRDGFALMTDLTTMIPDCPILIFTGFYSSLARVHEYTETLKQRVNIVTKPCQPVELLRHAAALLHAA